MTVTGRGEVVTHGVDIFTFHVNIKGFSSGFPAVYAYRAFKASGEAMPAFGRRAASPSPA